MPRFDFHCTACNEVFEESIPFRSKDLPACPRCQKNISVEKKLTPPLGIHFKGSGFYATEATGKSPAPGTTGKQNEAKKEEKTAKNEEKKPQKKDSAK